MVLRCLVPDYMFRSYREITPAFLQTVGIRALLIDIDNTLAPYEQPDADETHEAWFDGLAKAGICVALISNNDKTRVERFNRRLKRLAFWKSGKPNVRCLRRAMQELKVEKEETAILGDQLFTDAWAGKKLGLKTIIVPPIKDKTNILTRVKRYFERPFIQAYRTRHAGKNRI